MADNSDVIASGVQGGAAGAAGGPWGVAIGAGVGIVAGLMGRAKAEKDKKKQTALLKEAYAEWTKINGPSQESLTAFYETAEKQGVLTPDLPDIVEQADTELKNIKTDPALRQAQLDALSRMQSIGVDGMDLQDELEIERARQNFQQASTNQQNQVQESMARRGMQSSGAELAARTMAAQSSANQANDFERATQAEAQRRALEAIMKSGTLAGGMRDQDFGEQEKVASAQDAINRFSVANRNQNNADRSNITNRARQYNLDYDKSYADHVASVKNSNEDSRVGAIEAKFGNDVQIATGKANALGGLATNAGQRAASTQAEYGGYADGAAKIASAYINRPQDKSGVSGAAVGNPTTTNSTPEEDEYLASRRRGGF